jgi:uncharacterized protein YukE
MKNEKYPMPENGDNFLISDEICKHVEIAKLYKAQIDAWKDSLKTISGNIDILQRLWEGGSREANYANGQYADEYQNALPSFQCLGELLQFVGKQPTLELE